MPHSGARGGRRRRRFVVDGLLHRAIERLARLPGHGVGGATGPIGVGGDDQLAFGIDEDALAEDAARGERAVAVRPPLVAVAATRLADADAFGGGLGEPAVGNDAAAVGTARPVEDEEAEARKVARRGLDAAAADLAAGAADDPGGLLLHAGGHPDLLG